MNKNVRNLLLASTALSLLMISPAHAADSTAEAIKALQAQVNALQSQLSNLQADQKAQAAAPAPAAAKPVVTGEGGKEILPGVKVTLGGYVETDGIWREKNENTDTTSNFNTSIPFDNSPDAHQHEFRGSARASRLSLLTQGDVSKDLTLKAYIESDFLGTGTNSSSLQTSNYTPRLRHAFAEIDQNDWGAKLVGGQTWSLATLNTSGIDTLKIATTIGIDSGYLPGIIYDRSPQLRVVKSFADNKINVGLSAENPDALLATTATTGVVINSVSTTSTVGINDSLNIAPDVIGKVAFDPGFGHYEIFGMMRFFHDRAGTTTVSDHNNDAMAGGGGIGAYLPVIAKKLDVQASMMGGQGVGRYMAAQLPDVAFGADGAVKPLTEFSASVGLVGHPDPTWDLYTYAGYEKIFRMSETNTSFGYGDYGVNNNLCRTGSAGTCSAVTSSVWQVTPGFWKRFYQGNYGTMQAGASYSLTRRNAFSDANGVNPHAFQSVVMTALRYSPF